MKTDIDKKQGKKYSKGILVRHHNYEDKNRKRKRIELYNGDTKRLIGELRKILRGNQ